MVGELRPGEAEGKALWIERSHRRAPLVPLRDQPIVDNAMPLLEVGPLNEIPHRVELEGATIARYFQSPARAAC